MKSGTGLHAPCGSGGTAWTAALGGNTQGLKDLARAGGADSDHTAKHGAAMSSERLDWLGFDVAGSHRQGARCAPWREGLVLGVPPPSFALAHCHENRILRQRSSAKRLNGAPAPELQTYNPL